MLAIELAVDLNSFTDLMHVRVFFCRAVQGGIGHIGGRGPGGGGKFFLRPKVWNRPQRGCDA